MLLKPIMDQKKNMLIFSSKVTKHPNKRKHLEKYCRYFYSANAGLLFIIKQKINK